MHCYSLALSTRNNYPMLPTLPLAAAVGPIELAGIEGRDAVAVAVDASGAAVAVMAVAARDGADSRQLVP